MRIQNIDDVELLNTDDMIWWEYWSLWWSIWWCKSWEYKIYNSCLMLKFKSVKVEQYMVIKVPWPEKGWREWLSLVEIILYGDTKT